jgi:hypothetical protein
MAPTPAGSLQTAGPLSFPDESPPSPISSGPGIRHRLRMRHTAHWRPGRVARRRGLVRGQRVLDVAALSGRERGHRARGGGLWPGRQVPLFSRIPSKSRSVCCPVSPRINAEPWPCALCCTNTPGSKRSASGAERGCLRSSSPKSTVLVARPGGSEGGSSTPDHRRLELRLRGPGWAAPPGEQQQKLEAQALAHVALGSAASAATSGLELGPGRAVIAADFRRRGARI